MSLDLAGQTAVVTGASSGIGRAIAERLGADGAHVVLSGRTAAAMSESVERITAAGGRASVVVGDVREPTAVRALIDAAVAETGRLDILVNNAGVAYLDPVLSGTDEQWRNMLETNVLALLVSSQAAIAAMRAGGRPGHIVNISSIAAMSSDSGVYGATKHAVNVISSTLREELLNDPIKVTSVMPGLVATNIGRNVDPAIISGLVAMSGIDVEFTPGSRLPDEVLAGAQAALSEIMIRPEDVAEAVHFVVTQPEHVHIGELTIRPNKDFDL
jgi:NADP-dependent 3-hydroxy acid dehydrogenase YdfG